MVAWVAPMRPVRAVLDLILPRRAGESGERSLESGVTILVGTGYPPFTV
jgi:hypothetical protein